jgi:hypothetical protein
LVRPVPDGGAKIDWHIADAAALPIADAAVDVVLCQMGLMFIETGPPRSPKCGEC